MKPKWLVAPYKGLGDPQGLVFHFYTQTNAQTRQLKLHFNVYITGHLGCNVKHIFGSWLVQGCFHANLTNSILFHGVQP